MKRIWLIGLICISSLFAANAQDQPSIINQHDIDDFLGFANEYKDLAAKYFKNAWKKSVSELFYAADNAKWLAETDGFLKKKAWSYDKMSNFLYTVYLAILAINYYDSYGNMASRDGGNLFADVPKPLIALVRKNLKFIKPYFPEEDLYGYEEDDELPPDTEAGGEEAVSPLFSDSSRANAIRGDIVLDIRLIPDVKITAKFDSGADELGVNLTIMSGNRPVKEGEKHIVKPWTVKGGHIETTWEFPRKEFKKGSHSAVLTVYDPDGFEVGMRVVEFVIE